MKLFLAEVALFAQVGVLVCTAEVPEDCAVRDATTTLLENYEQERVGRYLAVYTNGMSAAEAQREAELFVRERRVRKELLRRTVSKEEGGSTALLLAELKVIEEMRRSKTNGNERRCDAGMPRIVAQKRTEEAFARFARVDQCNDHYAMSVLNAMRDLRTKDPDRFGFFANSKVPTRPCVFCGSADLAATERIFFSMSRSVSEREFDPLKAQSSCSLCHCVGFATPCCSKCLKHIEGVNAVLSWMRYGLYILFAVFGWGMIISIERAIHDGGKGKTIGIFVALFLADAIVMATLPRIVAGCTYSKLCGLRDASALASCGYEIDTGDMWGDSVPRTLRLPTDMGDITGSSWKGVRSTSRHSREERLYEWMGDAGDAR